MFVDSRYEYIARYNKHGKCDAVWVQLPDNLITKYHHRYDLAIEEAQKYLVLL